jgi:hypothetical protein
MPYPHDPDQVSNGRWIDLGPHAHKGKGRALTLLAGLWAPIPVLILNRGVSFPLGSWNRLGYVTSAVTARERAVIA